MRRFFRLPDCTVECCPNTGIIRIAEFAPFPHLAITAQVGKKSMRQVIRDLEKNETLSLSRALTRSNRLKATSL